MNILVLGAGAMGSLFGGHLALAGHTVTMLDVDRNKVDEIKNHGIRINRANRNTLVAKAYAVFKPDGLPPQEICLLMVKASYTKSAINSIKDIVKSNKMPVLSLQNGLGNEEIISEIIGIDNTIGGVTYRGAVLQNPGEVLDSGAKPTIIGEMTGKITERIRNIAKIFTNAGIPTDFTDNIKQYIWNKLLGNIAVSPVSSIFGLPVVKLRESSYIEDLMFSAVEEAIKVAKVMGIEVSKSSKQIIDDCTSHNEPRHKASMLIDLESGKLTEIDVINGAVAKIAKECGLEAPINELMVKIVHGLEFVSSNLSKNE